MSRESMSKYIIMIKRLGLPPIRGVRLHSEEHARKLCARNKGWTMEKVDV
jgi:hypothetical protein